MNSQLIWKTDLRGGYYVQTVRTGEARYETTVHKVGVKGWFTCHGSENEPHAKEWHDYEVDRYSRMKHL